MVESGVVSDELPLIAIHTVEGKYIYISQKRLSRFGIDAHDLLDKRWQNFCADDQARIETSAIRKVMRSDACIKVCAIERTFTEKTMLLDIRISKLKSKQGNDLILREAWPVQTNALRSLSSQIDKYNDDEGDFEYCRQQIKFLISIAKRAQLDSVAKSLQAASLEIDAYGRSSGHKTRVKGEWQL